MNWLFLLLALSGLWLTFNMYRPMYSHPRWAFFSFFAGWLWGELALHAIVFQVLATLFFVSLVGLETLPANLAVLATIGSCIALARGFLGARDTVPAVERALCEGLGDGYVKKVRPELCKHFEQGVRWSPVLLPFPIRHPEVERVRDIKFDRQNGIDLKLDVYRHRSRAENCPTLLQIHGGGWVIGDKGEQALPLMTQLASRGWVCVSANYRLSPHATFPDHLRDVKRAIMWIREHGAEFGANPDFLVVTGGSAGGHLAALVALTANDLEYQPGFENVDTSVRACIPVYGVYDFTDRHGFWSYDLGELLETKVLKGSIDEIPDLYRKASPMDRIHPGAPPFCIIHGDRDSLVPVAEARMFADMVKEASGEPVVYIEIAGAQHAFELFPSLRTQAVVDGIERFVGYTYSRYLDARDAEPARASKPAGATRAIATPIAAAPAARKRARTKAAKKPAAAKKTTTKRSAKKSAPKTAADVRANGAAGKTTKATKKKGAAASNGNGSTPRRAKKSGDSTSPEARW